MLKNADNAIYSRDFSSSMASCPTPWAHLSIAIFFCEDFFGKFGQLTKNYPAKFTHYMVVSAKLFPDLYPPTRYMPVITDLFIHVRVRV